MCQETERLDLEGTVSYIGRNIQNGVKSFFINTAFGKLAVEAVIEFDPMDPVQVVPWDSAPATRWTLRNKKRNADLYVGFGVSDKASDLAIYLHAIEAIHKCFFLKALGIEASQDVVDASVMSYLNHVEHRVVSDHALESEHMQNYFNGIGTRNNYMVRNLVKNMISQRKSNAVRVLETGEIILTSSEAGYTFYSDYEHDVFCITCYVVASGESTQFVNRNQFAKVCDRARQYVTAFAAID